MNAMKNKTPIADCRHRLSSPARDLSELPIEPAETAAFPDAIINCKSKIVNGFTLVELLTVIAIIAVLAAFLFPTLARVKHRQYINNAKAEMAQLETAIDQYKAAYGFYPPGNPNGVLTNQLYYELLGTTVTNINNNPEYQSLEDPGMTALSVGVINGAFGVNGFMNCTKPGGGEDARAAQNFLPGLKPNQVAVFTNDFLNNQVPVKLLVVSVGGPDVTYRPLGPDAPGINPWRYNSSNPTNNPGGYDLWVQLSISGKKNLVCNWSKSVQLNSPLR
jgi:prepilin-type N-terminal cleavage/methylation domain-containing protein